MYKLEDFVSNNDGVDVIVGFEGDYKKNLTEELMKGIVNIYAADFLGYLAVDEGNIIDDNFYMVNRENFSWLNDRLADEKSRLALYEFIEQKRTGRYDKNYDDTSAQYFDAEIIGTRLANNEIFCDCGAFRGETSISFKKFLDDLGVKGYSHIYAFEPDHSNVEDMMKRISDLSNIDVVEAGVSDKTGKRYFESDMGSSSKISDEGSICIDVFSIDDFFKDKMPPTYIKMDIEGSELSALLGAEQTIRKSKPKLAVCIYHKKEDLVEIPKYILSLNSEYKLYVRSYSRMGVETVLYAVPNEK